MGFHTQNEGTISVGNSSRPGTAYGEAKGGARPGAVDAWRESVMGTHMAIPWETSERYCLPIHEMGDFLW